MEKRPLHPQRDLEERPEQKSPALADQRKQNSPPPAQEQRPEYNHHHQQHQQQQQQQQLDRHEKIKLKEINPYLTCHLCKGYLIDATTISECLHSFCRSCIIKFLEENSFCPVCEVIINKAKPNLKLDKTLQDIVYKLVPGLFLSEMLRRKKFFADRPSEAGGASPEQRGEDTERTIFNPQDRISLSLEYIGDAVTSGIILRDLRKSLEREQLMTDATDHEDNKRQRETNNNNNSKSLLTEEAQSLLKRYLQCPGMCRIDVIKKFIRNKYNVNTDLFQIDILYKRVPLPLPDHYTLIDVAYIYTWKRNEPMRFYFRIVDKGNEELPDLTKVFTPIETQPIVARTPQARSTPLKKSSKLITTPTTADAKERVKKRCSPKKNSKRKGENGAVSAPAVKTAPAPKTDEEPAPKSVDEKTKPSVVADVKMSEVTAKDVEVKSEDVHVERPHAYKNFTLNRTNNSETVTEVRALADKEVRPVAVKIIDGTVTRTDEVCVKSDKMYETDASGSIAAPKTNLAPKMNLAPKTNISPKLNVVPKTNPDSMPKNDTAPKSDTAPKTDAAPKIEADATKRVVETRFTGTITATSESELERQKAEFLKSIELTSKKTIEDLARMIQAQKEAQRQQTKIAANAFGNAENKMATQRIAQKTIPSKTKNLKKCTVSPKLGATVVAKRGNDANVSPPNVGAAKSTVAPKLGASNAKRKNPSPIKNAPKRTKTESKKTTKIIIQEKPSIASNKTTNELRKNPEFSLAPNRNNDLHSLFQNCRLNIPSSLSITLKEDSETNRKPVTIPPVQNYIEILKIDEKEGKKTLMIKPDEGRNIIELNKPQENGENATNTASNGLLAVNQPPAPKLSPNNNTNNTPIDATTPSASKENNNNNKDPSSHPHSFQKIFEESIRRTDEDEDKKTKNENVTAETSKPPCKKSKVDARMDVYTFRAEMDDAMTPRCPTPMSRALLHPSKTPRTPSHNNNNNNINSNGQTKNRVNIGASSPAPNQTLANLRSTSLGLNYTVSVGKQTRDPVQQTYKINGVMTAPVCPPVNGIISSGPVSPRVPSSFSPAKRQPDRVPTPRPSPTPRPAPAPSPSFPSSSSSTSPAVANALSPNQLLEKYKIQNLAQLSASINLGAANFFGAAGGQMAALHKVMMLKQLEQLQQNRQLSQFEKYMQSLCGAGGQILRNNNNGKDN